MSAPPTLAAAYHGDVVAVGDVARVRGKSMERVRKIWGMIGGWLPWVVILFLLALLVRAVHPAALIQALRGARPSLLVLVLAFGLLGLLFRAIRWHLLLGSIEAPNTVLDSVLLFTASQGLSLVPAGQFMLPVLQRSQHGTLIRRSAATILVQELISGLLVLPAALPSLGGYHAAGWVLLAALVFSGGTGAVFLHGDLSRFGLSVVARIPYLREHLPMITELRDHVVIVASSGAAIWGSFLDMAAIGCAGAGFYCALLSVGVTNLTWISGVAVYALGSAAGTISTLPGGIGANEDISTLALVRMGLEGGHAGAATLLFRAINLAMGTALGWIVLLLAARRFGIRPSFDGLLDAVRGVRGEGGLSAVRDSHETGWPPA